MKTCNFLLMFIFISYSGFSQETESTYQCDYMNECYIVILSSGPLEGPATDLYGIAVSDLMKFQHEGKGTCLPESLPVTEFVNACRNHLEKTALFEKLEFESFEIKQLHADDYSNSEGIPFYYILVTFRYDNKDCYQIVPMLADGRIILGINE